MSSWASLLKLRTMPCCPQAGPFHPLQHKGPEREFARVPNPPRAQRRVSKSLCQGTEPGLHGEMADPEAGVKINTKGLSYLILLERGVPGLPGKQQELHGYYTR